VRAGKIAAQQIATFIPASTATRRYKAMYNGAIVKNSTPALSLCPNATYGGIEKTTIIQVVDTRTSSALLRKNVIWLIGAARRRFTSRAINRLLIPVTTAETNIRPKRPRENP
jgi:hypothetical protein